MAQKRKISGWHTLIFIFSFLLYLHSARRVYKPRRWVNVVPCKSSRKRIVSVVCKLLRSENKSINLSVQLPTWPLFRLVCLIRGLNKYECKAGCPRRPVTGGWLTGIEFTTGKVYNKNGRSRGNSPLPNFWIPRSRFATKIFGPIRNRNFLTLLGLVLPQGVLLFFVEFFSCNDF